VTRPRRPTVAVAYGTRSAPPVQVATAAAGVCDLVWLVDQRDARARDLARLLGRWGPVVEIGGLAAADAAAAVAAYGPNGLVTFFDAGMVELATLAEDLGLAFHSPEVAAALVDKHLQRSALDAAGIEGPRHWLLPADAPAAATCLDEEITWPAVLKPRAESGSHHTYLVSSMTQVTRILAGMGAARPDMLLEEHLADRTDGRYEPFADYLSVESIGSHGTLSHLAVTGRFPPATPFRETGFCLPAAIDPAEAEGVIALADRALSALAARTGCFHTEIKLTPEGPRVIEVNGRLGGGVADMVERAAGVHLLELALRVALGEPCPEPGLLTCGRVGFRFFLQPPAIVGRVTAIDGIDALADHPLVDDLSVHRGPGSAVDWREGTRTYILAVVGSADDHAGVLEVERILREKVHVSYEREEGGPA